MKSTQARGTALLNVLIFLSLMFVVAFFAMASFSSHLQLTTRYLQRSQLDFAVRAATNEALIRISQLPPSGPLSPPPNYLNALGAGPEVELIRPSAHLPFSVWLKRNWSVDNAENPEPAQSMTDPPGQASVPPFSLSLGLQLKGPGGEFRYESIIQRRWPYTLVAPGPILVAGAISSHRYPELATASTHDASLVRGRILAMAGPAVPPSPPNPFSPSYSIMSMLAPYGLPNGRRTVLRWLFTGRQWLPYWTTERGDPPKRVKVGGEIGVTNSNPKLSYEARAEGGIDFLENADDAASDPEIDLHPESQLRGSVRKEFRLGGLDPRASEARQKLASIFTKPDTSRWPVYTYAGGLQGLLLDRQAVPSGRCQLVADSDDEANQIRIQDSSLNLNEVSVAVNQDLILTGCRLRGSDASLIVDGTIVLDGGQLDAGGNGLVIYCRRLIARSSGHFRGLIIAEQGAHFRGGSDQDKLIIEGGLLVGANELRIFSIFGGNTDPLLVPGVALIGTELRYAPQYARGLNRYAAFQTLGWKARP